MWNIGIPRISSRPLGRQEVRLLRRVVRWSLAAGLLGGCGQSLPPPGPLAMPGESSVGCVPVLQHHDAALLHTIVENTTSQDIVFSSVDIASQTGAHLKETFVGPLPPEGEMGPWPDPEPPAWIPRTPVAEARMAPGETMAFVMRVTLDAPEGVIAGTVLRYEVDGRPFQDTLDITIGLTPDCSRWKP